MKSAHLIPALLGLFAAGTAAAQTFRYIDASTGPTGNTARADGSVFSPPLNGSTGADGDWEERTGFANGGNVIEAAGEFTGSRGENAPEIRTVISDLTPGATYQVNIHFWDGGTTNAWSIRAGYASNPDANTHYVAVGDRASFPDATEGVRARSLSYDIAPSLFAEADRSAYAASMGPAVADDSGRIAVYIDDLPNLTGDPATRTWYDGVSYTLIAPPPAPPAPTPPLPEPTPMPGHVTESTPVPAPTPDETPASLPPAYVPPAAPPAPLLPAEPDDNASGAPAFRRPVHR